MGSEKRGLESSLASFEYVWKFPGHAPDACEAN